MSLSTCRPRFIAHHESSTRHPFAFGRRKGEVTDEESDEEADDAVKGPAGGQNHPSSALGATDGATGDVARSRGPPPPAAAADGSQLERLANAGDGPRDSQGKEASLGRVASGGSDATVSTAAAEGGAGRPGASSLSEGCSEPSSSEPAPPTTQGTASETVAAARSVSSRPADRSLTVEEEQLNALVEQVSRSHHPSALPNVPITPNPAAAGRERAAPAAVAAGSELPLGPRHRLQRAGCLPMAHGSGRRGRLGAPRPRACVRLDRPASSILAAAPPGMTRPHCISWVQPRSPGHLPRYCTMQVCSISVGSAAIFEYLPTAAPSALRRARARADEDTISVLPRSFGTRQP